MNSPRTPRRTTIGRGLGLASLLLALVLALYGIVLLLGVTVAALFLGTWLLDLARVAVIHPVWALLLGVVILALVALIPVVGGIIMFVAVLFGLGSLLVTAYRSHQESRISEVGLPRGPRSNAA